MKRTNQFVSVDLINLFRDKRLNKKYSQGDLAELVNCHPQIISNYERMVTNIPLALIKPICDALDINLKKATQLFVNSRVEYYVEKINEGLEF